MITNITRSEGNTDKMYGYLEGHADGIKHGMENMKTKACREFSKIIAEICPQYTEDYIDTMTIIFRKRLEE
jgi:hypothetical protein